MNITIRTVTNGSNPLGDIEKTIQQAAIDTGPQGVDWIDLYYVLDSKTDAEGLKIDKIVRKMIQQGTLIEKHDDSGIRLAAQALFYKRGFPASM